MEEISIKHNTVCVIKYDNTIEYYHWLHDVVNQDVEWDVSNACHLSS